MPIYIGQTVLVLQCKMFYFSNMYLHINCYYSIYLHLRYRDCFKINCKICMILIFQVRFVDNSELVTVHVIVAWNYAYRAARISPWEVVARDSNRFKSKIQSLEPIISRVLRPEHRQKIWETRMSKYEPLETGNLRTNQLSSHFFVVVVVRFKKYLAIF